MKTDKSKVMIKEGGGGGAVYCLGIIGALVYYLQQAENFWAGIVGIFKALTWPAFLIYELLKSLSA